MNIATKAASPTITGDADHGLARSRVIHRQAHNLLPDGVGAQSQRRDPHPIYFQRAEGARLYDVDGNAYIDFMLGAGPAILGHRHPAIVAAVQSALEDGLPNTAAAERQIELAALINRHIPSMERVRFLPTGTEAVQAAIRLARRATGRSRVAKFEGAYHGQADNVMVSVAAPAGERGPADAPRAVPYHCPLPEELLSLTLVLPYNDPESAVRLIERHAHQLAIVLVEPMLGFAGAIPAEREFLEALRCVTQRHGIVLAFDEVITGFRVRLGGAQGHYGVSPDLTILGKAIGGGLPLAALGGRTEIMNYLSAEHYPRDYVFQSGTFSALPLSIAAGLATIRTLEQTNGLTLLQALGEQARNGLRQIVRDLGLVAQVTGFGSLFHIHFTSEKVHSARQAEDADTEKVKILHQALLARGVHFYAGRLGFLCTVHSEADIHYMLASTRDILASTSR